MENIGKFLEFCDELGVPKSDIFQTVDLYEGQNIPGVSSGTLFPDSSHGVAARNSIAGFLRVPLALAE